MIKTMLIVLFDLLLFYLLFGQMVLRWVLPRGKRLRRTVKDVEKHLRSGLRRNWDILDSSHAGKAQQMVERARHLRQQENESEMAAFMEEVKERAPAVAPSAKSGWIREYLEVIVVALSLAFGVRALFLQPFKIPTGSMQPTLYGIHFRPSESPVNPNPIEKFFDYLHYSWRPADVRASAPGYLRNIERSDASLPFLPVSDVQVGNVFYELPGLPGNVHAYLLKEFVRHQSPAFPGKPRYDSGDMMARGHLQLGDHLFVDRTRYAFAEPQRGDIAVFQTDGITEPDGSSLRGKYYIKRLVGLPGDRLRIRNRRLYVMPADASEFQLLDGDFHPAFERIYSFRGGYRGYAHDGRGQYLTHDNDVFTVPEEQYFMLGDNTENSKDSRFWGGVPRANLVGRACFVWWPFSRRWGLTDGVEPLPGKTVPTTREGT